MTMDPSLEITADAGHDGGNTGSETIDTAPTTDAAPAVQPEKTYTRAELEDAISRTVQQRLSRRSLEEHFRTQGWLPPSEARTLRQPPQPSPEADPAQRYLEQVIEAKMQERLAPLQAKEVSRDLDSAIGKLTSGHPELSDQKKLHDVLDTVVELGLDKVGHLSVEQALEVAYRYWREVPDIESIKKQAADEASKTYLTKKVATASKTPAPEGTGGQGAVGVRKINSRKDFERALEEGLARMDT